MKYWVYKNSVLQHYPFDTIEKAQEYLDDNCDDEELEIVELEN